MDSFWPQSAVAWITSTAVLLGFIGAVFAYFKGWVLFRESIDQRFEKVHEKLERLTTDVTKALERIIDDVIGLPRNQTVKGEMNGLGRRIDDVNEDNTDRDAIRREKIGELFAAQTKIRDMENDIKNIVQQLGKIDQTGALGVSELRALTRDTNTRLEDVARELAVLSNELKHIEKRKDS